MFDFSNAYSRVKQAVVAITPMFQPGPAEFPDIIGTGFFVSSHGVVCTCRHVITAFNQLSRPEGFKGIPAAVLVFRESTFEGRTAWAWFAVRIRGYGFAELLGDTSGYVGPNPPDIGFLLLDVADTPVVEFSEEPLREGEWLAFSGFPMGTRLLRAPGWLHQVGPTLHAGVVSAVLPHALMPVPHGFIMQSHTQGGASGSPVFRPDGKVVGMVYMGIREDFVFEDDGGVISYQVPTSLTGCVPREALQESVAAGPVRDAADVKGRPSLDELIANSTPVKMESDTNVLEKWKG